MLSDEGISSSGLPFRPSVPKDVTFSRATVEASELISWRVPTYLSARQNTVSYKSGARSSTYRMSLFETRDILALLAHCQLQAQCNWLSLN